MLTKACIFLNSKNFLFCEALWFSDTWWMTWTWFLNVHPLQLLDNTLQLKLIRAKMTTVYIFSLNSSSFGECCICEFINTVASVWDSLAKSAIILLASLDISSMGSFLINRKMLNNMANLSHHLKGCSKLSIFQWEVLSHNHIHI